MDSPQTHIWGPQLWFLLHSLAERIGTQHIKRLPKEETRLWLNLINSLRFSLPCPLCKKHYTAFYSSNPIHSLSDIKSWLFNLHNNVNNINHKSSEVSIENLSTIYNKPFNFSYHYGIVLGQMKQAIKVGWCNRDDVIKTNRFFEELKRFYDLF